jgi:hypothetical protein
VATDRDVRAGAKLNTLVEAAGRSVAFLSAATTPRPRVASLQRIALECVAREWQELGVRAAHVNDVRVIVRRAEHTPDCRRQPRQWSDALRLSASRHSSLSD